MAKRKYKTVVSVVLIVSIIFCVIKIIQKDLKIYFIDVGQGDACLMITPQDKKILIDGGGSETYDVGEKVLIPYLLNRRINKLDYLICSHFDTDHIGGILTVMEELKVNNVVISKQGEESDNYNKFKEIIRDKKIKVLIVNKGDRINIENDLYFDIIWPNNSNLISVNELNNNSIVCKLFYKDFSLLFTGDIEEIAEIQILKEYKGTSIMQSTVLKVAHHGSKTSSTKDFLEAVSPKIALIGVGKNNTFGHPNNEVIQRLKEIGTRIYRTDQDGEISITVNKKGKIKVKKNIEQKRMII